MNPSRLSEAFCAIDSRFVRLSLISSDPQVGELTLLDWIRTTDDDDLRGFLTQAERDNQAATKVLRRQALHTHALAEKKLEQDSQGRPI